MGYLIGLIIYGVIFGFITSHVAESKGYEGGFAWGFWLGIIGLLVVGFRPNKPKAQKNDHVDIPTNYRGLAKIDPSGSATSLHDMPDGEVVAWVPSNTEITVNEIDSINQWADITYKSSDGCIYQGYVKTESLKIKNVIPATSQTVPKVAVNPVDLAETLEKLSKLHDQGIITDEEFQQKKSEILAKM